jgi:hypothetical protein
MTLDNVRTSESNDSAPQEAKSSFKITRTLALLRDPLSQIDRAAPSRTDETGELLLPKAGRILDGAAEQHQEHVRRLVLSQVDAEPAAPPEPHGPSRKSRKALYTTLALSVLLALMFLAGRWRTQAFERRAALSSYELPVLTHELRYHLPEAGKVFLVWGIDGWHPVSESLRPAGTRVENGKMTTPTERQGDVFVVTVQAPANATVEYGFLITANRRGHPIPSVWDASPDYQFLSVLNRTIHVEPSVTLEPK